MGRRPFAMSRGSQAAAVLEATGIGALLRRIRTWRGVLVVNHHRVGNGGAWATGRDVWSASADQLDAQMRFLSRNFDVVSAAELVGSPPTRAGRRVAVTFDDGYRECYDVAFPILRAHGIPATFFLTTGFIDGTRAAWWDEITWMANVSGRATVAADGWLPAPVDLDEGRREASLALLKAHYKTLPEPDAERFLDHLAAATGSGRRDPAQAREDWLTWEMAREMRRAGMALGGHSVNHPILARQSPRTQRAEIEGCLDRLDAELGERPQLFSYPEGTAGAVDATTKAIAARAGVRLAFMNVGGVARGERWDPLAVPRYSLGHSVTASRFRAVATLPQVFAR
jgi:peptidoglycan/xylan/chitin deacetylase (PgdA/CDA1 family)